QRHAGKPTLCCDVHFGVGLLGRRRLSHRQLLLPHGHRTLERGSLVHRQFAQHERHASQPTPWCNVHFGLGLLGRRLLGHHRQHLPHVRRTLERGSLVLRHLAQHKYHAAQPTRWCNVHFGVGLLGRRRVLGRRQRLPHAHRALERDSVVHRHLAQHQCHGVQPPLWCNVLFGVGLLGRRPHLFY